jgi:hypothetical protein
MAMGLSLKIGNVQWTAKEAPIIPLVMEKFLE